MTDENVTMPDMPEEPMAEAAAPIAEPAPEMAAAPEMPAPPVAEPAAAAPAAPPAPSAPPAPPAPEPVAAAPMAPPAPPAPEYAPPAPPAPPAPAYAPPAPPAPGMPATSPARDEKQKVVAGVLAILLGWLGVHKFYLGYKTEGIIMAAVSVVSFGALSWIPGIVGIIEGVMYLTKTDQDFYQTYVAGRKPWF